MTHDSAKDLAITKTVGDREGSECLQLCMENIHAIREGYMNELEWARQDYTLFTSFTNAHE